MWGLLELIMLALLIALAVAFLNAKNKKTHNVETIVRKRVALTADEARSFANELLAIADSKDKLTTRAIDLQRSETGSEIITFDISKK